MQSYVMICYIMSCYATVCYVMSCYVMPCHVLVRHEIQTQKSRDLSANSPIRAGAFPLCHCQDVRCSGWELPWPTGEQGGTWSPLICSVEAVIQLLCEGAGAPGRSSSLPAARRQSSLLAFEVGADLKGKPRLVSWRRGSSSYRPVVILV